MITLDYLLTARSRVSVGSGPEVTFSRDAQAVIPGSTIRGALAAAYSREHGFDWTSPRLRDLFERHAWFSQAVPHDWALKGLKGMSYVECKYPKNDACREEAHDVALVVAAGCDPEPACPSCGKAWKEGKGWGEPDRASREQDRDIPRTSLVTTVRTELANGVAKDENLFARRALETGVQLCGSVRIDEDIAEDSLEWLTAKHQLRVGGQRSVLGAMDWTTSEAIPAEQVEELPARVVLRCQSPMIVVDEYGAPTMDPTLALRQALWDQVRVVARWVRPVRVSGWHMASGLPKPEEWALAAGSTFVIEGGPRDLASRLVEGIGLRRREGFGEIRIVDRDPAVDREVASSGDTEREAAFATREQIEILAQHLTEPSAGPGADQAQQEPDLHEGTDDQDPPDDRDLSGDAGSPIGGIVGALGAKAGVNGLLSALTQIRLYRQNGYPTSIISTLVRSAMATPWARALPPVTASQVEELLTEEDQQRLADNHAEVRRQGLDRGYIS